MLVFLLTSVNSFSYEKDFIEVMKQQEGYAGLLQDSSKKIGVTPWGYYIDIYGKLHVGYGHLVTKASYDRYPNLNFKWLNEEQATKILIDDLKIHEKELIKVLYENNINYNNLCRDQQQALLNMFFNLGSSKFRQFKKMLKALAKGDVKTSVKEMLNSEWSKQLERRSTYIANQMLKCEEK